MNIKINDVTELIKKNLDLTIAALSGDKIALFKIGVQIWKSPFLIRNHIFYQNFQNFLKGMEIDPKAHRHFLEFLNEGDKDYKAKKILMVIDGIDSNVKSECIINLSKSVGYKFISSRYYMKLCSLVNSMVTEDLIHLRKIIKSGPINDELIDEYERNGLMYLDSSRSYVFSKMAFNLDKYALSYADEKYNYSGEEKRIFPDKFKPQMTFLQDEMPANMQTGDTWISESHDYGDEDK